jgi:Zn-dependent metalloprotease/subtilisin family serine protease
VFRKLSAILLSSLLTVSPLAPLVGNVAQANGKNDLQHVQDTKLLNINERQSLFLVGNLTAKSNASPSDILFAYMNKNKEKFHIEGDAKDSFKVTQEFKDHVKGNTVIRLQQMYKGIPVYGSMQVAHVSKDGVLRVLTGAIVPNLDQQLNVNSAEKLTDKEAIQIAEKDLAVENRKYVKEPTAVLHIYTKGEKAYLVYVVELNYRAKEPGRWLYFIDANSGKIVHKFNNLHFERAQGTGTGVLGDNKTLNTELENGVYSLVDTTREDSDPKGSVIKTFDGENSDEYYPETVWTDEDNQFHDPYDAPAVDAHYYAGVTYDYFKNVFERNGIDDEGKEIKSIVHYGEDYNNAYWDGEYVVFGDGDGEEFRSLSGGLDVVAHELTHGVTEHTAGLIYEYEPGAINEAMSDIFGTLVEFYDNRNPDWLIGEDVYTPNKDEDALRSLEDPAAYGYPDHYSQRYRGEDDNGGVHINSSIINKAAYLISEGGTHYGVEVEGIGLEKLGKIFYRTLTQYLTPTSNFHQLRAAAIQAAKDLYEDGSEVETVKAAFQAVGIEGPKNVEDLEINKTYQGTFEIQGQEKWFKIDPSSVISDKSHILFEVSGIDATITVYPSFEHADKAVTYSQFTDVPQAVEFPIAWEGPYYVKVTANEAGDFELTTTSVYKTPVEHQDSLSCLAELAAKEETTIFKQLSTLRNIRDHLLRQSKEGKELISLYYSVSNETINDFLLDKEFRKLLINDLTQLQPIITELRKVANGQASSYTLSEKDYETLSHLKGIIEAKVPNEVKEKMNHYWSKLGLEKGTKVSLIDVLNRLNISSSKASSSKLIIKFKGTVSEKQVQTKITQVLSNQKEVKNVFVKSLSNKGIKIANTYVVSLNNPTVVNKVIKELEKMKDVAYAEPNYQVHASAIDVQYPQQWSLENEGQTGGIPGADINYKGAVSQLKGKTLPETVIAVLDTGVNYELTDFKNVVDTEHDFDFINGDNDAMDDHFHGTHVSGIIAAASNNGYSMTGINSHAKILPIKVLDSEGSGTVESVALGIGHAVDMGAKVINLSLGMDNFSKTIDEMLKYAYENGVTVIAAAGNDGKGGMEYPASSKYAIAVGATDNNDQLARFSNYGPKLEIVAPGVLIPSLTPYGEVELASGTSMAAPHVSAVAGLVYSLKNNVSPSEVRQLFRDNSVDLGEEGFDIYYGYGRLDAAKVISALTELPMPKVNNIDDNDKEVTGTAQSGLEIIVNKGSSLLGKATVDSKGNFTVSITPQKAGTTLTIYARNKDGWKSKPVTKTVLDKTAPSAPKVNEVGDRDTKVTGTAEAGAKVVVKVGSTKLGETTAGKDGKFSVTIKAQKAGTILKVTATDKAGNTSPATTIKVQSSKK